MAMDPRCNPITHRTCVYPKNQAETDLLGARTYIVLLMWIAQCIIHEVSLVDLDLKHEVSNGYAHSTFKPPTSIDSLDVTTLCCDWKFDQTREKRAGRRITVPKRHHLRPYINDTNIQLMNERKQPTFRSNNQLIGLFILLCRRVPQPPHLIVSVTLMITIRSYLIPH